MLNKNEILYLEIALMIFVTSFLVGGERDKPVGNAILIGSNILVTERAK
jgi:hypothetical protein